MNNLPLQFKVLLSFIVATALIGVVFFIASNNTEDATEVSVPAKTDEFIMTSQAQYRIDSLSPSIAFTLQKNTEAQLHMALLGARESVSAQVDANAILYENILPDVDFESRTFDDILQQNIIMHKITAPHTFKFDLSTSFEHTSKFALRTTQGIFVTLYDSETNEELIQLNIPRAQDAAGNFIAYHYRLSDDATTLILEPHKEYNYFDFQYPITLSASIHVREFDYMAVKVGQNSDDAAVAKDGDIVAIKPEGWSWGSQERRDFVLIKIPKLTNSERVHYASPAEVDGAGTGGMYRYAIDYTQLATEQELAQIRNYSKENPTLDASELPREAIFNNKIDTSVSYIPESRRLAKRVDESYGLISKIIKSLIKPVYAQTTNIYSIGTGSCASSCDYSTLQLWETARSGDLTVAGSNSIEKGEVYNDSAFSQGVIINGATTDSTHYMWLTVAAGERHTGRAGTGARVVMTAATSSVVYVGDPFTRVEWLEIDGGSFAMSGVDIDGHSSTDINYINNMIIHDFQGSDNLYGIVRREGDAYIYNNIVYDFNVDSGGSNAKGIELEGTDDAWVYNNTIYNMRSTSGGAGDAMGIDSADNSAITVYNNIAMLTSVAGAGVAEAFDLASPASANYDYNMSDDASAAGSNSLTNQVASEQFSSIESGYEDFHLTRGSSGIDVGTSSPSSIFTNDTDGDTRGTWDIGVDEVNCQSDWWSCQWSYRRKLEFDTTSSATTTDLVEFTAGIHLNSSRVSYANTQDAGQDIRFVDDNGTTTLQYEIEGWDESGTSTIWVKVTQIDQSSSTDHVWLYYGNTSATTTATTTGAWNSNFVMVQHLQEAVNNNAGGYVDSTEYGNHGTGSSMALTEVVGIAGTAQSFDGSADSIDISHAAELNPGTGPYTMEAWVNHPDSNDKAAIVSKGSGSNTMIGLAWCDAGGGCSSGQNIRSIYAHDASNREISNGVGDQGDDQWHYGAITITSSVGSTYVDTQITAKGIDSGSPNYTGSDDMVIGELISSGSYLEGYIDEIRISDVARTDDWLEFTYCNVRDTCNTYGAEEQKSNEPSITSVTESGDPVAAGDVITWTVDWSDADSGELIKVHACSSDGITNSACDATAYCSSPVFTNRDPENLCQYTSSSTDIGTLNYYIFVCDDGGACSGSASGSITVQEQSPTAPTDLLTENMPNPINVATTTPSFSAIFNDPNDLDLATKYCIHVNTQSDFAGTDMWLSDGASCSTGSTMTTTTQGTRSPDIKYAGTALTLNGTTYYWRINFWDDSNNVSATSTTGQFTLSGYSTGGGTRVHGSRLRGGVRLQ